MESFSKVEILLFFGGLFLGMSIGMLIGKISAKYLAEDEKDEE
jgi:hypothetical protein